MIIFKRLLLFFLSFLLIQYSIIFATPENTEYDFNNFVWSISSVLNSKQEEIKVSPQFKNQPIKILEAIKTAFALNPENEISVKGIHATTEKIKFYYIEDTPIFKVTSVEDLKALKTYINRLNIKEYTIAFPTYTEISDLNLFLGIDPINTYANEQITISIYNKEKISSSMQTDFNWNYPSVYTIKTPEPNEFLNHSLEINQYVAKETARINPKLNVKSKVKAVNDIIVSSFKYDLESESLKKHYPIALIQDKKGVCSAYAMLGYEMLRALNVPTLLIEGMAVDQTGEFGEHMWLLVRDESGIWHHFDPTFNDPIPDQKVVHEEYLWLDDIKMSEDHTWINPNYTTTKNNEMFNNLQYIYNPEMNLQINSPYISINNITTLLDNNNKNITPILINDTTYLPIRVIAELYGASVDWLPEQQQVVIYYKNKTIKFTINDSNILCNNKSMVIPQPPIIFEGRTLLPLRSVMELLDKNVTWNGENQQITIK